MSETEMILDAIGAVRNEVVRVHTRIDASDTRLGRVEVSMGALEAREAERNGSILDIMRWRQGIDERHQVCIFREVSQTAYEDGAEAVKAAARSRVAMVWGHIEKPVIMGAAMLVFGVGLRIGAFFVEVPW